MIEEWTISGQIALNWMSLDFTEDKSTLVQVMAWCRQATSHYLSQYWPKSVSPYGVIWPQWVNLESITKKLYELDDNVNMHFIHKIHHQNMMWMKLILVIDGWGEIVFRWKSLDLTDDKNPSGSKPLPDPNDGTKPLLDPMLTYM